MKRKPVCLQFILSQLGYPPLATDDANLLFQLINGRYERKSTIVTTNLPLSSWGVVLHNLAAAEAILVVLFIIRILSKLRESHTG